MIGIEIGVDMNFKGHIFVILQQALVQRKTSCPSELNHKESSCRVEIAAFQLLKLFKTETSVLT